MNIKHFKQHLFSIIIAVFLISCFSITASAVWDGQGLPAGGSANTVTGDFSLPTNCY